MRAMITCEVESPGRSHYCESIHTNAVIVWFTVVSVRVRDTFIFNDGKDYGCCDLGHRSINPTYTSTCSIFNVTVVNDSTCKVVSIKIQPFEFSLVSPCRTC